MQDPGFTCTMRDQINLGEKMGLIDNSETWMKIRGLRNISVHEYNELELDQYFKHLLTVSPSLLATKVHLSL